MDLILLVVTLVAVNVRRNLLGLYYEAAAHAMPRLTGGCTARHNRTRPDSTKRNKLLLSAYAIGCLRCVYFLFFFNSK